MATAKTNVLSEALGAPLPQGLEGLSKPQLEKLASTFAAAKVQQRAALADSTEAALSHVPMLLRGAVRKVLFG
ncbi:MAG: hypothetical protein Q7J29_12170 [Stagnimonas sp.]|nr:hypothetical protein [Stagnimonas sp.]